MCHAVAGASLSQADLLKAEPELKAANHIWIESGEAKMVFRVDLKNESGVHEEEGFLGHISSLCQDPATVNNPVGLEYGD